MAVSRIEDTTPRLVGKRLVHQPIRPEVWGDELCHDHLTRLPIWLLNGNTARHVRPAWTRLVEILRAKD